MRAKNPKSAGDVAQRLAALAELDILDTAPEPDFDDIVQIAQRVCNTPVSLISLVAEDRQWFKARVGFDPCETPISQSVCAHALIGSDLLVIPDLTQDPRTRNNTLVTGEPRIRFYAGAVLKTREGVPIGSLCVIDDKPRPEGLNAEQAETLRALARQTMSVMGLRKAMMASESARARLLDDEAMLREAQEAARIGAFEVDIASNRFTLSAEFCRIFGLPPSETIPASELEDMILLPDRGIASSRTTREDASSSPDVEYRIRRRSDGALRWMSRRGSFVLDEAGHPIRMLGVVQDVTDRKNAETRAKALIVFGDQLRDATTTQVAADIAARLMGETLSVSRTGYAMIHEANGSFEVEDDWTAPGVPSIAGRWDLASFATTVKHFKDGSPLVVANMPAALWLGADVSAYTGIGVAGLIAVPVVQGDRLVGVVFIHSDKPRTWSAGEIDFTVAVADRTHAAIAKIQAEQHQHVLNEELSHRLKNTLSMVQAIVTQTLRGVAERETVRTLENRIIALSKAHDVLLQQSWTAARISTVIDNVINLHSREGCIKANGPNVTLEPKATLSLSLLLHEMATNAIKYGSLSVDGGYIELSWRIETGASEPTLVMVWREMGGPPAVAPKRRGFGSRLIAMGIAGSGNAEIEYTTEGLRAEFRAPMRSIATH